MFIQRTAIAILGFVGFATVAVSQPPMGFAGGGILSLDTDGDGRVSREEFQPPGHRRQSPFERADADGDGALTRDELIAAIDGGAEEREQRMREHLIQRFDETDADGNGVVTEIERQNQAFNRVDTNGDGFVTDEEAQAMHDKRRARHGRRFGGDEQ